MVREVDKRGGGKVGGCALGRLEARAFALGAASLGEVKGGSGGGLLTESMIRGGRWGDGDG